MAEYTTGTSVKRVIRHWLGVLDDIKENSKAVLDIFSAEHITER